MKYRNILKSVTKLFIVFFFNIICNNLLAQIENATFERVTLKDGLSQSTVNDILQDKHGFLWFATYGGLNKYDGYTFTVYRHDKDDTTSITLDGIDRIMEDYDGNIWISPNGETGLDVFNPGTEIFTNFRNDPSNDKSLSSNVVQNIMQDSDSTIWVCASNAINRVLKKRKKGKTIIQFERIPFVYGNSFNYIFENFEGKLLLFADSLFYLDKKTNIIQKANVDISASDVLTVVEEKSGNLIIGTTLNGIVKLIYNKKDKTYTKVDAGKINVSPDNRSVVYLDSKNNIWIGTESKGIYKYNIDKDQLVNFMPDKLDDKSISDNTLYSMLEDHSGILWIGSFSQGLCKYNLYRKEFDHFRSIPGKANSLSGDVISSISGIDSKELWVGNDLDGGINRIIFSDSGEPEYIHYKNDPNNDNSIAANNTLSLVQRKNGDVWLGSAGGTVTRIIPEKPGTNQKPIIKNYRFGLWTFTLFEDSEGTLWGGTWQGGFWRFDDETEEFITYMHDPDNPTSIGVEIIWAIGEDQYHNIWIGGNRKGISIMPASEKRKTDAKFINYDFDKDDTLSISSNTINAFCLDHTGTMWIGTGGGLNKVIDNDKFLKKPGAKGKLLFSSYHENDGLPSETIIGIVEDKQGNLWMSTSNGVSKFDLSDTTFSNYFESDGLQSNEFWHNAYFINSEGRVFFGGQNGFNAFYPEKIKSNPFEPIMVFTDLKLFNKSVKIFEKINKDTILIQPIYDNPPLNLSYKNNVFSLEFSALHYTHPPKNQYAYFMEGFDEDWSYIGNQRTATFTNLNKGKYILHIKGTNSDGTWGEKTASISIRIWPPWWKTWAFRIAVFLVLVYMVYLIVKARNERVTKENEILLEKIEASDRELRERRKEIELQKKEIADKEASTTEINWYNNGMAILTEVIGKYNKDIGLLTKNVLQELIKYVEANMGAVYMLQDSNVGSKEFKITSGLFIDKKRVESTYPINEGYLGACYSDKKLIEIDDLPENYARLESGLGSHSMKYLLLIPMINDNVMKGVIELASINKIPEYRIKFIEKIAETLASSIEIILINDQMQNMVKQLESRSQELNNQQEEMKQNLEEMLATQEENDRITQESKKKEQELLKKITEMKEVENLYKELKKKYEALEKKVKKG